MCDEMQEQPLETPISMLPPEILLKIFDFLEKSHVCRVRRVNRLWLNVGNMHMRDHVRQFKTNSIDHFDESIKNLFTTQRLKDMPLVFEDVLLKLFALSHNQPTIFLYNLVDEVSKPMMMFHMTISNQDGSAVTFNNETVSELLLGIHRVKIWDKLGPGDDIPGLLETNGRYLISEGVYCFILTDNMATYTTHSSAMYTHFLPWEIADYDNPGQMRWVGQQNQTKELNKMEFLQKQLIELCRCVVENGLPFESFLSQFEQANPDDEVNFISIAPLLTRLGMQRDTVIKPALKKRPVEPYIQGPQL